jgi:tRNA pseudouridine13 synthase
MLPDFSYLYGKPAASALFKRDYEDFIVDEVLPFEFSGDGEHMLVHLEKRGQNTAWVASQLAHVCNISPKNVSFAGLKDRQGVTRQWFSVQLPGKDNPDLSPILGESLSLIEMHRHHRKLRRGALSGNRFEIRLREVSDMPVALARLEQIAQGGVPNYFGSQRFGHQGRNVEAALKMFEGRRIKDRNKRSIYLSAARSLLFNQVVSARIDQGVFNQLMTGDCLGLSGSQSFFCPDWVDESIEARLAQGDLLLTAPMYGRGELPSRDSAKALESTILADYSAYCEGLETAGLKMERRGIKLLPQSLQWAVEGDTLILKFYLPAGCYATSVLRELAVLISAGVENEIISE